MKSNLRPIDAAIRGGVGLALLASPLLNIQTQPYNWLGLILIGTAVLSFCPIYLAFRSLIKSEGPRRSAQSHA